MTTHPRFGLALLLAVLCLPRPGAAQEEPLQPVDQGIEDRGVLSMSLRRVEAGLQVPAGFEHVYRVPGREDLFMRIDGALYAVFPQSQYRPTKTGMVAGIPSQTVFFIGSPEPPALSHLSHQLEPAPGVPQRQSARLDPQRVRPATHPRGARRWKLGDRSLPSRVPPPARAQVSERDRSRGGMRLLDDSAYRRVRLHGLLRRAAEASSGRVEHPVGEG